MRTLSLLAVSTLAAPAALACTVCGGGGQNQQAFIDTMVFMTVTPLLLMGSAAGFLFWRYRQVKAESVERPRLVRGTKAAPQTRS